MAEITGFVTNNLVWILVAIIIILLAIIGRYAEQTNFGEGKKIVKVKKKKSKNDLVEELEVEKKDEPEEAKKDENTVDIIAEMQNNTRDNFNPEANEQSVEEKNTREEQVEEEKKDSSEMTAEEFMKSEDLDVLLPKKDVVTGDFLQEVEDLDLDFKKKDILSDIPDLDDIDLPNIKKKNVKTDIWN